MPSFCFASYEYDSEGRALRRDGQTVHAEPKVLACLELFVRRPGETLSARALMVALWPQARVSPVALRRVIVQVRKLLTGVRLITVRAGGYRLEAAVTLAEPALQLHAAQVPSFEDVRTAQRVLPLGPFALNTLERVLTRSGRTIPLADKPLDCLVILARSPNRLVTHARLQAALWPQRDFTPQALKRVLRALRTALGEELRIVVRKGLGYVLEVPLAAASPSAPDLEPARAGKRRRRSAADAVAALAEARAAWRADSEPDLVRAAYVRAFELAREAGDQRTLAEAAIGTAVGEESALALAEGYFLKRMSTHELELALARLPATEHVLRHRVARTLCWVRGALGDREGARVAARLALEHMPPPSQPNLYAMALAIQGMEGVWAGSRTRARRSLRELRAACARLEAEQAIEAHLQAMTLCLVLGDVTSYRASRVALARLADALPVTTKPLGPRQAIYRLAATLALVTLATIEGEFRDAERHLTELSMLSQKLGLAAAGDMGVFMLMLLPTMRYQGRAGLLRPLLAGANFPDEQLRAVVALLVALDAEDRAEAAAQFASLRTHGFASLARTDVLASLADACVTLGTDDDARALHAQLTPWRDFCASDGAAVSLGAIARALGELELRLGDRVRAEHSFRRALQLNRELGHRPELVRTRLGLARATNTSALEARAEAAAMGMEPWR